MRRKTTAWDDNFLAGRPLQSLAPVVNRPWAAVGWRGEVNALFELTAEVRFFRRDGRDDSPCGGSGRLDFRFVYSRLMTACNFTPDQIGEMEMHDVIALFDYWRDCPPVPEILAAVHGIKPRTKHPTPPVSAADPSGIGGQIARFPSGKVPEDR